MLEEMELEEHNVLHIVGVGQMYPDWSIAQYEEAAKTESDYEESEVESTSSDLFIIEDGIIEFDEDIGDTIPDQAIVKNQIVEYEKEIGYTVPVRSIKKRKTTEHMEGLTSAEGAGPDSSLNAESSEVIVIVDDADIIQEKIIKENLEIQKRFQIFLESLGGDDFDIGDDSDDSDISEIAKSDIAGLN